MKKALIFFFALATLAACKKESEDIVIVPYPNDITFCEGCFNVKGAAVTYDPSLD